MHVDVFRWTCVTIEDYESIPHKSVADVDYRARTCDQAVDKAKI